MDCFLQSALTFTFITKTEICSEKNHNIRSEAFLSYVCNGFPKNVQAGLVLLVCRTLKDALSIITVCYYVL